MEAPRSNYPVPSGINITAHNEILRDIKRKLDDTIYVTDARGVCQNGVLRLQEPLFQRTVPGYLASFFKTNVVAPNEEIKMYEDALIAMINQHKAIYTKNAQNTVLKGLSNQERTFAEQNKVLINDIITIARRIFQSNSYRVPADEIGEPYSVIQKLKGAIEGNSKDGDVLDVLVDFVFGKQPRPGQK